MHPGTETGPPKALALNPRAARIHYNYGTHLLQSDRYADALQHLNQPLSLDGMT